MAAVIRHLGVSKNTGSNVIVVFRKLPDDPQKALILYKDSLPEVFAHKILTLVEGVGQNSIDLYDVMDKKGILEGKHMLSVLHTEGLLKVLNTSEIVMHVGGNQKLSLDDLNAMIDGSNSTIADGTVSTFNPFDENKKHPEVEKAGLAQRLLNESNEHRKLADELAERAYALDSSLIPVLDKDDSYSEGYLSIPEGISQAKAVELVKKFLKERKENE